MNKAIFYPIISAVVFSTLAITPSFAQNRIPCNVYCVGACLGAPDVEGCVNGCMASCSECGYVCHVSNLNKSNPDFLNKVPVELTKRLEFNTKDSNDSASELCSFIGNRSNQPDLTLTSSNLNTQCELPHIDFDSQ